MRDGERYPYILDPGTDRSIAGILSASILAALSTTVFVLRVERGLALFNRLSGIEAIPIDAQGKLHYSDKLLLSTKPKTAVHVGRFIGCGKSVI